MDNGRTTDPDKAASAQARWELPAGVRAVPQLRKRVQLFALEAGASADAIETIGLAVSEAVTNAVLHAYAGTEPGIVALTVRHEAASGSTPRFVVEVSDRGWGIADSQGCRGVGQGLALIGALADELWVTPQATGPGTRVKMAFAASSDASAPVSRDPGRGGGNPRPDRMATGAPGDGHPDSLCELALATVADASSLDRIQNGVLRRVTAQVAGDPALSAWLARALPPAKPGTATWAALRDGTPRLTVHDPSVPRSPGGTGDRLSLMWWIAVPLTRAGDAPMIWGFGGRDGGRPVPPESILAVVARFGDRDLGDEAERRALAAALRGRLD